MKGTTMTNETNELQTYAIRRLKAWGSPDELEQVAARSKQVADDEFPTEVRWIRSYVIAEDDGTLGTVCIYQAVSPDAIRRHAHRVGMPADQIWNVADTVVIRPDPDREAVAS
jgi:Nickel responsive protein SCO4226-like